MAEYYPVVLIPDTLVSYKFRFANPRVLYKEIVDNNYFQGLSKSEIKPKYRREFLPQYFLYFPLDTSQYFINQDPVYINFWALLLLFLSLIIIGILINFFWLLGLILVLLVYFRFKKGEDLTLVSFPDIESRWYSVIENFYCELKNSKFRKSVNLTSDIIVQSNPKRGLTEKEFQKFLEYHFADFSITININTALPVGNKFYYPDFLLFFEELNLYIDLEIDEPYSDQKTIHFLGQKKEEVRNSYFLNHQIVVLRFAEYQIVKYPDYCCQYILDVIFEITGIRYSLDVNIFTPSTFKVKRWSREDAFKLMAQNFRSTQPDLIFDESVY